MKNLIVEDEKTLCAAKLEKPFRAFRKNKRAKKFKDAYFIGDDNFLCDYFFNAVSRQNNKEAVFKGLTYVRSGYETTYREYVLESNPNTKISIKELLSLKGGDSAVFG